MDRTVKTALGAGMFFVGLAWWASASAASSDFTVADVPDMTSAEQVVRLVVGGRGMSMSAWVKSKVDKGWVVLAGPKGVTEGAMLFSVDKARAQQAVKTGFFRIVGGSV